MKAVIITFLGGIMMVFTLAAIQTIEWCTDRNIPVPWQAYALLIIVAVWCVLASTLTAKDWDKADCFFKKLTKE